MQILLNSPQTVALPTSCVKTTQSPATFVIICQQAHTVSREITPFNQLDKPTISQLDTTMPYFYSYYTILLKYYCIIGSMKCATFARMNQ